ncbi:Replication protein, partial [Klebsiella pneumoniae]
GKSYVKHARWVELWRECLRVSYDPNVDVRAVKPRKPKDGESLACATAELVRGAVAETLKYSTKPADMVADPEWFLELTARRTSALCGDRRRTQRRIETRSGNRRDMVIGDDISEGDDDGSRIAFEWKTEVRKYRRSP